MGNLGSFTLGVAAAMVARVLGPAIARRGRPLVRGAIKQGMILSHGARVRAEELREDWDDLVAEAREDLDRSGAVPPAAGAAAAS